MSVQTVLCPVDFSAASEEAVRYAIDLCRSLGAARLDIGHVMQRPVVHLPEGAHFADEGAEEQLRHNARRQLESLARRHSQHEIEVTHTLLVGVPTHDAILEHAKQIGADLVVMSTLGRTGLARMLLGSVAEKVVRLSPVPVCTVRSNGA